MGTDWDRVGNHQKRWPKEARQLVTDYLSAASHGAGDEHNEGVRLRDLISDLASLTRYSRQACRRFARRLGLKSKQNYRKWTESDQQKLLNLIAVNPPTEVAKIMRRSPGSVRAMLHRLGTTAQMGRDWFTKYTLAEALHIRVTEVERWIQQGWLRARTVQTGRLTKEIIDADDFTEFCKRYSALVVGRRLNRERLEFVRNFVFPPSHTELLPVRESKKERASYEAQMGEMRMPAQSDDSDDLDDMAIA